MPDEGARDGFAACQPVTIPNPAAGAGFTYSVPGSERQLVLAVSFLLTASADAANRRPVVTYKDGGGGTLAAIAAPFLLTANGVSQYTFALGVTMFGADDAAQIGGPLPWLPLDVGETVVVTVTSIDNTDAITGVRVFVQQFPVRP